MVKIRIDSSVDQNVAIGKSMARKIATHTADASQGLKTVHLVDKHVGSRLKRLRSRLGVSQEQLGSHVGLTFQQIQKYEKGLNRISCSKLYEFARYLGTNVGYFFQGLDESSKNDCNSDDNFISSIEEGRSYTLSDVPQSEYSTDGDLDCTTIGDIKTLLEYFAKVKDRRTRRSVMDIVKNLS